MSIYDSLFEEPKKEQEINLDKKLKRDEKSEIEKSNGSLFDEVTSKKAEKILEKKYIEERTELKSTISTELANKIKDKNYFGTKDEKDILYLKTQIIDIIQKTGTLLSKTIQKGLINELVLEITSVGKLHQFLVDPTVSEIMVNATDEVWIERKGRKIRTDVRFDSEAEVLDLANKIATNVGRSVNNSQPILDARLPDGSRVAIILPPISIKGVTITIRKFFEDKLKIEDLIRFGSITPEAARFLEDAVKARANIIVSGGTGSGKTTTLNIVSNFVPNHERILTMEDSAELQLNNEHVVRLETRDANAEGKGRITIRDLVTASLRNYPDRIIVGEVRDGTAFDLLQSMNTGHEGSMATVHANDPDACLARLESLVLMAGMDLPSRSIRQTIASAVDLIVQIQRLEDGSRKITHISEVTKYNRENDSIETEPIYLFKLTGEDEEGNLKGSLDYTGHIPSNELQAKFKQHKINFLKSLGLEKE